jgi:deoxyribodipyrimidine photolyase-related protein
MNVLRLVLGDQLSHQIASLRDINIDTDIVLMAEVAAEATYVKHHKRKIAFLFAAMRHFAEELRRAGTTVIYRRLDDPDNGGCLESELLRVIESRQISKLVVTMPGEYRLMEIMKSWQSRFEFAVELREDDRFLSSLDRFTSWADGRRQLRMDFFYREMRRDHNILMDGGEPIGGKWNFDSDNRESPIAGMVIPPPLQFVPDKITSDVLVLVAQRFADHFGDLNDFGFAVTREQALAVLDHFIDQRLPDFGKYQDAMILDEPWVYHSHIGFYMNAGLLLPAEVIAAAETAYHGGHAPLNSVEGFIRQILGWREFVRGIYWLKMPEYAELNFFEATRDLPEFYWSGDTKMLCMAQAVNATKKYAYAHHIQRLMVLGNFALLAGLSPRQVNEWFLIVYADAYEWVELPNVSGMVLFADGGYLASKPYAAGGAYINRMSNYCKHCHYKVSQKNGKTACPFNYLYWDFLIRNRTKLKDNARLGMMYRSLDRMDASKIAAVQNDADRFLTMLPKV